MALFKHVGFLAVLLLLVASGCKHTKPTTATNTNQRPPENTVPTRKDAKSIDKVREEAVFVRACTEKMIGNHREALALFRECIELNPFNAAANYEAAGICLLLQQPERALKYAETAANLNAGNTWYQLRYASALQANGKYDDAANRLEKIANTQPARWQYKLTYADALTQAGRVKEAIAVYDEVEKDQGISDTLGMLRIRALKKINDKNGIVAAYEKLITAFPYETKYYLQLGNEYSATAQPDKAAATYRRLLAKDPSNGRAHLALATYYRSTGNANEAYKETVAAFSSSETPLSEKVNIMHTQYGAENTTTALSAQQRREADTLRKILTRINPDDAATWKINADYLYRDGNWAEARKNYRKAVTIDPSSWNPWMRLLELNDRLKDTASQLTEAKQALELFPSQPSAYFYYGQLMLQQKRWKDAIEPLSTGASYVTDDPEFEVKFYLGLIEAFSNQNKPERTDDYYEKILRLQPENTVAALGYATSLTNRNLKPVRAEELAQLVLNKEPENAAAMDVLAWSKYQLGSYQDAKSWMEKSLAKNPKSARANERMGDIQHALNNDVEAVRYWKKAREIGGANPALDRKIERRKLDHEE